MQTTEQPTTIKAEESKRVSEPVPVAQPPDAASTPAPEPQPIPGMPHAGRPATKSWLDNIIAKHVAQILNEKEQTKQPEPQEWGFQVKSSTYVTALDRIKAYGAVARGLVIAHKATEDLQLVGQSFDQYVATTNMLQTALHNAAEHEFRHFLPETDKPTTVKVGVCMCVCVTRCRSNRSRSCRCARAPSTNLDARCSKRPTRCRRLLRP